jgi:hypothetical protein
MFYQQLGGTKTMRQLNRTEKQLLSILAVYKQMGKAGALGDMSKTLNSFANQSRMMTEYWQQLKTWTGVVLVDLIEQSGVLVYINALLITMSEIMRAIAISRGAGQDNFIDGLFETTEATNEAVDELQGKLLDFDKFRSLSGAEENVLGIDEQLLQAIKGYSSQIDKAQNSAQQLADEWLSILGFTKDANGEFTITDEKLNGIKSVLKGILGIIGIIFGLGIISAIVKLGMTLNKYAIQPLIKLFTLMAVQGKKAIENWILHLMEAIGAGNTFKLAVWSMTGAMVGLTASVMGAFALIQNWGDMNTWQRIIGIIGVATTAILGLAMAFGVFHSAWSLGLASAGIVAGIAMIVGSIASVKKDVSVPVEYNAMGASNIDSSTLFVAEEMGRTEAVFNGTNGKTNVANIQQMQMAFNGALSNWWANAKHDIPQFREVSKTGIYEVAKSEMRRRGEW